MSGVNIFSTFLVFRSWKDRRCPACVAHSRDDVGRKHGDPWRMSVRSMEVSCWRFV